MLLRYLCEQIVEVCIYCGVSSSGSDLKKKKKIVPIVGVLCAAHRCPTRRPGVFFVLISGMVMVSNGHVLRWWCSMRTPCRNLFIQAGAEIIHFRGMLHICSLSSSAFLQGSLEIAACFFSFLRHVNFDRSEPRSEDEKPQ